MLLTELFVWGACLASAMAIPSTSHVIHERRGEAPRKWEKRSRLGPDAALPMRIGLTQANLHKGDELLMEVSSYDSPKYGQWYTSEDIIDLFAPSQEAVDSVTSWLHSAGIHPQRVSQSANKQWIQFDAKVEEAERLLKTEYFNWEHTETGKVSTACSEYSVPAHIKQHVDYITPGLRLVGGKSSRKSKRKEKRGFPIITPHLEMYKIPQATLAAAGNELGIFEEGDYYDAESLVEFFTSLAPNIPITTAPVLEGVDGGTAPGALATGESDLDLQISYPIIYPQNSIIFQTDDLNYALGIEEGNSDIDPVYPDPLITGYQGQLQCGVYTAPNVISVSYGEQEDDLPLTYQQRQCSEMMKLGMQGVSIVFASGDSGVAARSTDANNTDGCLGAGEVFNPDFPASCPYLTAVGATTLPSGANASTDAEIAVTQFPSGGGFSNIYARPDYQNTTLETYFTNSDPGYTYYSTSGTNTPSEDVTAGGLYNRAGRGYPDVAAVGQNIVIYLDGAPTTIGGTSASAPVFAAILNRINEERIAVGKSTVGFVNPTLYANPQAFNDITVGNNTGCNTAGFLAAPGWDPLNLLLLTTSSKIEFILFVAAISSVFADTDTAPEISQTQNLRSLRLLPQLFRNRRREFLCCEDCTLEDLNVGPNSNFTAINATLDWNDNWVVAAFDKLDFEDLALNWTPSSLTHEIVYSVGNIDFPFNQGRPSCSKASIRKARLLASTRIFVLNAYLLPEAETSLLMTLLRTMAGPDSAAHEHSPPSASSSNVPNDGEEDATNVDTTAADLFSQSGEDSPYGRKSKQHRLGLDINYPWGWSGSLYDDYDVVTVHGIRDDYKTAWTNTAGSWWVKDDLFQDLSIREALSIAMSNPVKYGKIPILTSAIVSTPHRFQSTGHLEDQLHKLILLPGPEIKDVLLSKVQQLARQVDKVNQRFLATKLLDRAAIFNVFSQSTRASLRQNPVDKNTPEGTDPNGDDDLPDPVTPFPPYGHHSGQSFEAGLRIQLDNTDHLDLIRGELSFDSWFSAVSSIFNVSDCPMVVKYRIKFQAWLLSLAPPTRPLDTLFDPVLPKPPVVAWIRKQKPYITFSKLSNGPRLMQLHGNGNSSINISELSRLVYVHYDSDATMGDFGRQPHKTMIYFEFDQQDSRYNNISSMLTYLINCIAWRFGVNHEGLVSTELSFLDDTRAWSLDDLYHVYRAFRHITRVTDKLATNQLAIFISCFDQCPLDQRQWFLERVLEGQSYNDAEDHIVLSTSTRDGLAVESFPDEARINLDDCPALGVLRDRLTEELQSGLIALIAMRPVYKDFQPQLENLLKECSDVPYLGRIVLAWLGNHHHGKPKSEIADKISKLLPPTTENTVQVFISSLAPGLQSRAEQVFNWVKHASEPWSPESLVEALAVHEFPNEEPSLKDLDIEGTMSDIEEAFGGIIAVKNRDVKFSHPSFYHVPEVGISGSAEERAAKVNSTIAESCLRYFQLKGAQEPLAELSPGDFEESPWATSLDAVIISHPRASMAERLGLAGKSLSGTSPILLLGYNLIEKIPNLETFQWPENIINRAAASGLNGALAAMLLSGYDINKVGNFREAPPAVIVAWRNRVSTMEFLLNSEHKPDLTIRDKHGDTLLTIAATVGCPRMIELLCQAGASVKAEGTSGTGPVQLAVQRCMHKALDILLKTEADSKGGKKDNDGDGDGNGNGDDDGGDGLSRSLGKLLVTAADVGSIGCVRVLLAHAADPNSNSRSGTALYRAVAGNHTDVAQLLLEQEPKPDMDVIPPGCQTLLMCAVSNRNTELVSLLIGNGAKVDVVDPSGGYCKTPLSLACYLGDLDTVKLLLAHKAGINYTGDTSDSPLFSAVYGHRIEVAKHLLQDETIDVMWAAGDGLNALHAAWHTPDIISELLRRGVPINSRCALGTALHIVTTGNNPKSIKALLANDPKPDLDSMQEDEIGYTPLQPTCIYRPVCAEILLKAGANPKFKNKNGEDAVDILFRTESDAKDAQQCLKLLLSMPYNVPLDQINEQGRTRLHNIKEKTLVSIVQLMVEAGAPLDSQDHDGYTPLAIAISESNESVAEYLIKQGASVNTFSPSFGSMLHLAVTKGDLGFVKLLVDSGADVETHDSESLLYTALGIQDDSTLKKMVRYLVDEAKVLINKRGSGQFAYPIIRAADMTRTKHPTATKLLKFLIRRNAQLDVTDSQGRRAVHLACTSGYKEGIEALVEAGAEIDVEDKLGRRPIHFAAAATAAAAPRLDSCFSYLSDKFKDTDIDVADHDNWTPLLWAARSGAPDTVTTLVERNADVWVRGRAYDGRANWSALKLLNLADRLGELRGIVEPKERTRVNADGEKEEWNDSSHEIKVADRKDAMCNSCLVVSIPLLTADKPSANDNRDVKQIIGIQWKCIECTDDFSLCFKCYGHQSDVHDSEHSFEEIEPLYFEEATSSAHSSPSLDDAAQEEP
ncbi:hypothetical protein B7494_g700 [Chlorociboria aeruginascens]|nr:hypothetical protein B7494_g700 [Chlorociboria aeruginascens]